MKEKEKSNFKQDNNKKQTDFSLPVKKKEKNKFNVYEITAVGFFEHLSGFIFMIFVIIVSSLIIYLALEILIMLKGLVPKWENEGWLHAYLQMVLSNWLWLFVGATIPGFIQGVSFFQGKLTNKNYKDKPVKFGLIPLLLGSLIFPGILAILCISSINPTLFHFDGFFKILGLICFGIMIGAFLWWRVVNEMLKIRSSRSWW